MSVARSLGPFLVVSTDRGGRGHVKGRTDGGRLRTVVTRAEGKQGTTAEEWKSIVDKEPTKTDAKSRMAAALEYAKKQREKEGKAPLDFKTMSHEQMTVAEERKKEEDEKGVVTEVKMLTKDGKYRPKVSTWGVFPRPDNISKAYGGGRTLKPGGELESPEKRDERARLLKAKIDKYKKGAGLDVAEPVAKQAQEDFSNGEALMRGGKLEQAMPFFTAVIESMPPKSRLGGEAKLQRALCMDSLGRSAEAKEEYQSIRRHPFSDISKRAAQMLAGFEAAEFLKADQFDFRTQRGAYGDYLEAITRSWDQGSWNSGYTGDGDETEMSPAIVASIVAGLFLMPLGLVAYLVAAR
uniref:Uncharacterized protein n=1 Tax=Pyramimonas obovata TaxID=1411642 RepID=A0A7S0RES3_9CHLO